MVPVAVPGRAQGRPLKLLGKAAAAAALLAVALFATVRIEGKRLPPRTLTLSHAAGAFRAGAARIAIELPDRPVLAGYAGHRRARPSVERVYARAVVVEASRQRFTITAIDTLLIPPGFERLDGCELLAATHTHTGPGGLWDSVLAGWLGAGEPDALQKAAVQRARREAVAAATAALQPAELQAAREEWTAGPARARSEGSIDPDLVALRFRRPGGSTIATVAVYGMHPTSAPRDELSADWPGQVEAGDAPVLVLQGAGGNTTWPRDAPAAEAIAQEIERLLARAPALGEARFDCALGYPELPQAEASVRVPWLLRRAASNVLALALEPTARQTRLRIGPIELLGVPGEPVGELGIAARPTVLVGLASDYVGYVETGEHWRRGIGESGKTYFGPDLARALGLGAR